MKYDLYRVASIIGGPGFRDDLNRLDSGKRLLEMANTYPDDCRIHDDCLIMRYFPYDVYGNLLSSQPEAFLDNQVQLVSLEMEQNLGVDRIIGLTDLVHGDGEAVKNLRETNIYYRNGSDCTKSGNFIYGTVNVMPHAGGIYQNGDNVGFYMVDKSGKIGTFEVPSENMETYRNMSISGRSIGEKDIVLTEDCGTAYFNGKPVQLSADEIVQFASWLRSDMDMFLRGKPGLYLNQKDSEMIASMGEIYKSGFMGGADLPGRIYFATNGMSVADKRNPVINGIDFGETDADMELDGSNYGV